MEVRFVLNTTMQEAKFIQQRVDELVKMSGLTEYQLICAALTEYEQSWDCDDSE